MIKLSARDSGDHRVAEQFFHSNVKITKETLQQKIGKTTLRDMSGGSQQWTEDSFKLRIKNKEYKKEIVSLQSRIRDYEQEVEDLNTQLYNSSSVDGGESRRPQGTAEKAKDTEIRNLKKLLQQLDTLRTKKEQEYKKEVKDSRTKATNFKKELSQALVDLQAMATRAKKLKQRSRGDLLTQKLKILESLSWLEDSNAQELLILVRSQLEPTETAQKISGDEDSARLLGVIERLRVEWSQKCEKILNLTSEIDMLRGLNYKKQKECESMHAESDLRDQEVEDALSLKDEVIEKLQERLRESSSSQHHISIDIDQKSFSRDDGLKKAETFAAVRISQLEQEVFALTAQLRLKPDNQPTLTNPHQPVSLDSNSQENILVTMENYLKIISSKERKIVQLTLILDQITQENPHLDLPAPIDSEDSNKSAKRSQDFYSYSANYITNRSDKLED